MKSNPKWATRLIEQAIEHWEWQGGHCHHVHTSVCKPKNPSEPWTVSIAPVLQEVSECGPRDGNQIWIPFVFDIGNFLNSKGVRLRHMCVRSVSPESHCAQFILHLLYFNRPVLLCIFMEPPPNAEPAEIIDAKDGTIRNKVSTTEE